MKHAFARGVVALTLAGTMLMSGTAAFAATNPGATAQSKSAHSASAVLQGRQNGWQGHQHAKVAPAISSAEAGSKEGKAPEGKGSATVDASGGPNIQQGSNLQQGGNLQSHN